mgnify:CR=1 FL=1|jgi:hypothetical protein|tara:strand:+ start:1911 stop:2138 length:228 start_codon:yes stop_codon:yes gene_type:complete
MHFPVCPPKTKTLGEEQILVRKETLLRDLEVQIKNVQTLEKQKLESLALQNALTGAIQQCDDFLKQIHNVSSDEG